MVFPLSVKEVQTLLNHTKRTRDTLILRLMYLSLRVSDVLNLRFENIHWEKGTADVTVKGGKNIRMVIDPDTLQLLRLYCTEKGIKKGRIFEISRQRVDQIIREITKKTGIRELISAHKLRHSFAVHALDGKHLFIQKPLSLRQVQIQMGHSNITTTAIYLQYTDEERREAFGYE